MSRSRAHAPTQLQTLLLRAAVLPPEPAIAAWREARPRLGDVERLDEPTGRLVPQLYRNLVEAGVEDRLPEPLGRIYRYSWLRNTDLFRESAEVLRALRAAGVETVLLKGASMSLLYYRDAGARPMADLDLMVRPADVRRATQVLAECGWGRPDGETCSLARDVRFRHSRPYQSANGNAIDLHWAPLHEPLEVDDFWAEVVPARLRDVDTCALAPTDELLVACAHGLGRASGPVRWIADALVLIRAAGDQVDWERLVAQAELLRLTARLERAMRLLRTRFEAPVPRAVVDRLATARRPLFERVNQRIVAHPPPRCQAMVAHWDRYCRLRAVGSPKAGSSFLRYVTDHDGEPSLYGLARTRWRAERDRVLGRSPAPSAPTGPVSWW